MQLNSTILTIKQMAFIPDYNVDANQGFSTVIFTGAFLIPLHVAPIKMQY